MKMLVKDKLGQFVSMLDPIRAVAAYDHIFSADYDKAMVVDLATKVHGYPRMIWIQNREAAAVTFDFYQGSAGATKLIPTVTVAAGAERILDVELFGIRLTDDLYCDPTGAWANGSTVHTGMRVDDTNVKE